MKKRIHHLRIVLGICLVGVITIISALILSTGAPPRNLKFGHEIVPGRFPPDGSLVGEQISVLWITNSSPSEVILSMPYAEYVDMGGRVVRNHVVSLNQKGAALRLAAGDMGWIAMECKTSMQKWRYCFQIPEKGGFLLQTTSTGARFLHKHFSLPRNVQAFFSRHGLMTGYTMLRYESPWTESTSQMHP